MGHRSVDQRLSIVENYRLMFSTDLLSAFKSSLKGYLLQCINALCLSPADFDSTELRKAIGGRKMDEDTVLEILCTRSNAQIHQIKEAYTKQYFGRDLMADIKNCSTGHFTELLLKQCSSERSESLQVDSDLAKKDAQRLYDVIEKRVANTGPELNSLLCARTFLHMRFVFEAFSTLANYEVEDALKKAFNGNLLRSYLYLVQLIRSKPKYFAERLYQSMKGLGTNDTMLIRIIVTRCELDMGYIKEEFGSENKHSLAKWITDDTTGNYRRLLLALINEDNQ
ncbi:Annexin [Fasciolopsis buskii]|uniref:Annexin n=1 Tax=Fasciolopsis buskii TaxID=27845 RepID=A0A8E0RTD0_9TREM|nr:Annexin [Fasciolopsis buski]